MLVAMASPPGSSAIERAPRVSIGMPVFNSERYIEQALDSILAQSCEDFELLIVDNRSTDRTFEICQVYAARDPRIRCIRHRQNYGVVHNFNTTFRLSSGRYFKWAGSDDVLSSDFLARTVEILDRDASVVLAYCDIPTIDQHGRPVDINYPAFDPEVLELTASRDAAERFSATMHNFWYTDHMYGLIRSDTFAQTRLYTRHFLCDHILLSELSLHGRFHRIPEPLLFLRRHTGQTSKAPSARKRVAVAGSPPSGIASTFAIAWQYPKRLYLHASAIHRVPLPLATRVRCHLGLLRAIRRWAGIRLRQITGRRREAPTLT
jgi:glycosyltransferase involved in cell wall biosynthesis